MFKALKNKKIIAINDSGEFPCLVYDDVVEDTEHNIEDYIHCDGEFVLTTSDEAKSLKNKERALELHKLLEDADYWTSKHADGEYTEEEWAEKVAQRKAWREELRELENN